MTTKEREDKIIQQAQDILERRLSVKQPIKVNLQKIVHYSAYYQGLRQGLITAQGIIEKLVKGEDKIYLEAAFRLYTSSLRNTQLFQDGTEVRFRNWEHNKKGKLTRCEAYFVEHREILTEIK